MRMAPQNADPESMQVQELPVSPPEFHKPGGPEAEPRDETASEGSIDRIPTRLWVMHGAVMFGREFCYAMETALVTPILLQIGLPEQYYSLTWFVSPILGLIFTPLIGSASDRCTLSWGRRRPFILALCVGVLVGVALFLNGSAIGLALGDVPNQQPIGIVLTVLGVVVLDFSADATEGPIRAYLLDVVDSEEQDMALNIHAFSAGLGGAIGYVLGGLDWTQTVLGDWFRTQNQVLFFFAAIIFTVSVALHLFSIEEEQYSPQQDRSPEAASGLPSAKLGGPLAPAARPSALDGGPPFPDEVQSEHELPLDYLDVDMVRSKSDSVLHVPDAALDVEPELLFLHGIEPSIFHDGSRPGHPPEHQPGARQGPAAPALLAAQGARRGGRHLARQARAGSQSPQRRRLCARRRPQQLRQGGRQGRGPAGLRAPPPARVPPAGLQHLLLLRQDRLPPLPAPAGQRRGAHQAVAQHERPVRHAEAAAPAAAPAAPERGHHLQRGHGERGGRGRDHRAPALAVHAEDAQGADAPVPVPPAHLVLRHRRGRLLHRLHGPGHLRREPQGPLQLDGLARLQRRREDGLLGPGHLRGHRCYLLSPTAEVPGPLRPQRQGDLRSGHAGLLGGHGHHGHVPHCLRGHGHHQRHGRRLHEHLLLPLRPAGPLPRHQGVCPPQPRQLQARLRHRLRHPLVPGLHLADPGGVCPRGRGRRRGHRARHPHGGLRGLLLGLPDGHVPGDLPRGVGGGQGGAERPVLPARRRGPGR
uniref:Solute carrier family 45 member 4 n=1 Tax=Oryctolagus cuniculus TaxID=9986 RepID=A0A5F9CHU1_RABIT